MNAWTKIVDRHKELKHVVPPGWLTREEVAIQLSCSEDRVNGLLKDAMKAGEVDCQTFSVYSKSKKKVFIVPCYRIVEDATKSKKHTDSKPQETWPFTVGTRVRRHDGGDGVMLSNGRVQWDTGRITTPSGSTILKIKSL